MTETGFQGPRISSLIFGGRHEDGAELVTRGRATGADLAHERASLGVVDVDDCEREARPDEASGQAQLDEIALGSRTPDPRDPTVGHPGAALGNEPRRDGPVASRIHRK